MPKKNAFFYFMIEYKQKQESQGRSFRSLADVTPIAGEKWAKMNAKQREPYVMKAKTGDNRTEVQEKLTNLGIPYSQIDAEKREKESKTALLKTRTLELLDKAVQNQSLDRQNFYFISFAYFCRTSNGIYIPAELGVVQYSLECGVKDKLHMHINPGTLPLGMAFDAQIHADEDHQLPIPPNAMGESDYDQIGTTLLAFLLQDGEMPLLFTDQDDVAKVESMLLDILDERADGMQVHVCPLAELFFQLKKRVQPDLLAQSALPSVHIAQQIITRDVYDYTKGISCEYHDHRDNVKYCALSRCIRWAYVISDNCCADMKIAMEPGKHVPLTADTTYNSGSMFDTMSFVSQDDKLSFVSGSTISRMTYPGVMGGGPGSGVGVKSEPKPRPDSVQPKPMSPPASSSSSSSRTMTFSSMMKQMKQEKRTTEDFKSELNETYKYEPPSTLASDTGSAWGEPVMKQRNHGGRGMAATGWNVNQLGAGRGRGTNFAQDSKDDFPALVSTGRGRLFK